MHNKRKDDYLITNFFLFRRLRTVAKDGSLSSDTSAGPPVEGFPGWSMFGRVPQDLNIKALGRSEGELSDGQGEAALFTGEFLAYNLHKLDQL